MPATAAQLCHRFLHEGVPKAHGGLTWDGLTVFFDNPAVPLDDNQTERSCWQAPSFLYRTNLLALADRLGVSRTHS